MGGEGAKSEGDDNLVVYNRDFIHHENGTDIQRNTTLHKLLKYEMYILISMCSFVTAAGSVLASFHLSFVLFLFRVMQAAIFTAIDQRASEDSPIRQIIHKRKGTMFAHLLGSTILCRSSVGSGSSQPGGEARGEPQERGCVTACV